MISKRLRYEILRRDSYRCRYCGRGTEETTLVVDHVTPVALGGKTIPENLVAACQACNTGKTSVPPSAELVQDVSRDAVRWAAAIRMAADERAYEWELIDAATRAVDEEWTGYTYGQGKRRKPIPRPQDWPDTIERLVTHGLDAATLCRLVGVSMRKNHVPVDETWAYFCGCCWRTIEDLQARARQSLDTENRGV